MESSKIIIAIGLLVVGLGTILYFFPNAFKWFGNLPGDIKVENGNTKFYFPIVTMVILSVVANIVIRIFKN